MTMTTAFFEIRAENILDCLQEARIKLEQAEGETVLDFSAVRRIDPEALRLMEELVGLAEERAVKIALHGVNVDVYKVLKLVKLAPKLGFLPRENGRARVTKEESGHAESSQH